LRMDAKGGHKMLVGTHSLEPSPGEQASPELCQLVWLDDALEPLNVFETFLRFAWRKGRGVLRRLGVVAYGRLDSHRTPPWRRAFDRLVAARRSAAREIESCEPGTRRSGASGAIGMDEVPDEDVAPQRSRLRPSRRLEAGDLVRVKSLEDILETLDDHHKHDNLAFLRPMMAHCGKTRRVLKRVRVLVNDRDHSVSKVRNTVLLEGAMCDGEGIYGRERCDRSCLFFWKEAWLEKVDE
jgi:hypothetical protein